MKYLTYLKRTKHHHSCRWIVKYDTEGLVREVKLLFKPAEYREKTRKLYGDKARTLHSASGLIKILEKDKEKRAELSSAN